MPDDGEKYDDLGQRIVPESFTTNNVVAREDIEIDIPLKIGDEAMRLVMGDFTPVPDTELLHARRATIFNPDGTIRRLLKDVHIRKGHRLEVNKPFEVSDDPPENEKELTQIHSKRLAKIIAASGGAAMVGIAGIKVTRKVLRSRRTGSGS